jgi:hypothetical protein
MQANRQNTRQLAAGASEIMEWFTYGYEWSILNYGPGILWFSYTPGVDAAPGEVQSTRLEPGYSFTDSASAPRFLQLSLAAEGAQLTYCLNTNQRFGAGGGGIPPGGGGIEEAPEDGKLYGRRDKAWEEAASQAELDAKVNKAGDTMTGRLAIRIGSGNALETYGSIEVHPIAPSATTILKIGDNTSLFSAIVLEHILGPPGTHWEIVASNISGREGIFITPEFGVQTPLFVGSDRVELRFPRTISGDPVGDNDLTRKAYVDDLVAIEATQTLTLGAGWVGGQNLFYRRMANNSLLEMAGMIRRAPGSPLPPSGAATLIGQFPVGYRPPSGSQQFKICAIGTASARVGYGLLQFVADGRLLIIVGHVPDPPEDIVDVYINDFFSLTV